LLAKKPAGEFMSHRRFINIALAPHTLATRAIAPGLIVLGLTALASAPAFAVQVQLDSVSAISGSTFNSESRFVGTPGTKVDDTSVKHLINIADCKKIEKQAADEGHARVKVTWSWTDSNILNALSKPQYAIKVVVPGGACDSATVDKTQDGDAKCIVARFSQSFANPALPSGETFELDLNAIRGTAKCDGATDDKAVIYFIIKYTDVTNNIETTQSTTMNVDFDLTVPAAPIITSKSGGNQNVQIAWKHDDSNTKLSKVHWSELAFDATSPDLASKHSDLLTATSYTIKDLENEKVYFVGVTALDDAQNESNAKEVFEVRPVPVQDLWQYYKASSGASEGGYYTGCQSSRRGGSSGLAALLLALAALALVRFRRRLLPLAMVVIFAAAALAAPSTVHAVSPRTASLDLRFGYYLPAIDSEFADNGTGRTPYKDVMQESALYRGITIDWLVFSGFGELALGFGVAWWEQTGTGKSYDGSKTEDKTTMSVIPVTLDASYRFTVLAEKFNFPLVPYGRIGLGYGLWWMTNGLDKVATYEDDKGNISTAQGGVAGLHWSAGLRLLLDVFEPQAARGFDMELGVNHSYLFVEFQRLSLNNFGGDRKALDLSDDIVQMGLAFDL
jgi:hypothetical protein